MRLLQHHSFQNTRLWLQAFLVTSLVLLSVALAPIALRRQLWLVVYPFLGVTLAVLALRWPPLGLTVAATAGMVVPFYGPSGLNVTMIVVALLLSLWLLDALVHKRPLWVGGSRATRALLWLLLAAFVSGVVGQLSWFTFARHAPLGAQLGGLFIVLLSGGTFLLVSNQVHDLGALRWITWAFVAAGFLQVLLRAVLPQLGFATTQYVQPVGAMFYLWLVALAFSQAVFNGDLRPSWRLALVGCVLVTLYVLIYQKYADKSGWVPVVACMATIIGCRSWRLGAVLALSIGLAGYFLAPNILASEAYSISTRVDAWLIMAKIIEISPIWGLGFANYYWYTPLFPIRGYAVSFNSHNNYIDIAAQMGAVGLVCFLWFLWELGRLGWRLTVRAPDGFPRAFVYGCLGGLVGMVVLAMMADWVLPFVYNVGLGGFRSSMLGWLFLGGLVSLERIYIVRRPTG